MVSQSDTILRVRPVGETYEVICSNHKLQFVQSSRGQFEDLNKTKTYKTVGEILKQHKLENSGVARGYSNRPLFIIITSGPDRGKKLSEL
jgi:hypothetical protein